MICQTPAVGRFEAPLGPAGRTVLVAARSGWLCANHLPRTSNSSANLWVSRLPLSLSLAILVTKSAQNLAFTGSMECDSRRQNVASRQCGTFFVDHLEMDAQ